MVAGLDQLRGFANVLEDEDARKLLMNPVIPPERREAFLGALARSLGFDVRVRRLLGLLVERRRLAVLDDVIEAYQKLLDERTGTVRAVVTAAAPLSESERAAISDRLERTTVKSIEMEVEQDSSLIGGVIVRIGSTVYDGSVRQQLRGFKDRLLAG
jgi:F-type H+-transporting ATPase subunit delta